MVKTIQLDTWKKQIAASLGVYFSRFGFLPPNFSPLGSFGFFGGHPVLYFLTIVVFDLLNGGFYKGFLFTYLGFLGYSIFGTIAQGNYKKQILLLPAASFFFFLVSNFGVWLHWYPQTLEGLLACYMNALPFYKNTLWATWLSVLAILLCKRPGAANAFGTPPKNSSVWRLCLSAVKSRIFYTFGFFWRFLTFSNEYINRSSRLIFLILAKRSIESSRSPSSCS